MQRLLDLRLASALAVLVTSSACHWTTECGSDIYGVCGESETSTSSSSSSTTTSTTSPATSVTSTTDTTTGEPMCGDGQVDMGEECDDGENNGDDKACTSECTNNVCGDGYVLAGVEECDDGNDDNADECVEGCKTASCGDSFLHEGNEQCDDGNIVDSDECTATCTIATCGDGVLQEGVDECDDGNKVNADECSLLCHNPPISVQIAPGGTTPLEGGNGGSMFDDACPPGQALMGFDGKLDGQNWHGNLRGLCATLSVEVVDDAFAIKVEQAGYLVLRGANNQNGQGWMRTCPVGTLVVSVSGRKGNLIDQLTFGCAKPMILEDENGYSIALGAIEYLPSIGGNGGTAFPEHQCPNGQVATRQRGRAGNDLDAFGLGCGIISLNFQ
ncbi:MAG: DUF4215 domain-containing protein [Myxococcales bacterium]|nr:DUF4215 domain-containing protein [Myxococcales bacterium]